MIVIEKIKYFYLLLKRCPYRHSETDCTKKLNAIVSDMEVRLQRLERNVAKTGNDDALIQSFINIRNTARSKKDYVTADEIRKILKDNKIELEDRNDGTTKWWRAG